jgi:hypothetical protein
MYAKLRFTPSCTNRQRNLSIVKLITDYYNPPASVSFDAYPGLDSAGCEVISADSSHWTFAGTGGAQSLGSDALDYSSASAWHGSQYTLKTTYDTGHTQYADIKVMGNAENSAIYDGDDAPTMIVPRNRFGTTLENRQMGNNTSTSDADADLRGQGVSHKQNREIHIFADQTKLALLGSQQDNVEYFVFNALHQFDQPNYFKYYDKLKPIADSNVPCCWQLTGIGELNGGSQTARQNSIGWSSEWDAANTHAPQIHFPGNIYNGLDGTKYRNIALSGTTSTSGDYNFKFDQINEAVDDDATQQPNTTFNTTGTSFDKPYGGVSGTWNNAAKGAWTTQIGFRYLDWPCNAAVFRGVIQADNYSSLTNMAYGRLKILDSNGNNSLTLTPTLFDWASLGGNMINMSEKAGIYRGPGGAGFWGDSAEIDGNKYQYFPISSMASIVIRRD